MKISFVIPAYNEEALLPKCLQAIERELGKGAYDAEIIVVNNASTDHTREIAASFPNVKVVDETHKGLTRARHAGHMASTGDLIANVDADTMLSPGWIDTVFTEFEHNQDVVALSGPFIYYDLPMWRRAFVRVFYMFGFISQILHHHVLGISGELQGGNFVLRRKALESVGGFDRSIEFYGEDTDIARRLTKVGRIKWTFRLPMYASGRRLQKEGMVRMGMRYASNRLWLNATGRPLTKEYIDVRH